MTLETLFYILGIVTMLAWLAVLVVVLAFLLKVRRKISELEKYRRVDFLAGKLGRIFRKGGAKDGSKD